MNESALANTAAKPVVMEVAIPALRSKLIMWSGNGVGGG